jgi:hypothetical protein
VARHGFIVVTRLSARGRRDDAARDDHDVVAPALHQRLLEEASSVLAAGLTGLPFR